MSDLFTTFDSNGDAEHHLHHNSTSSASGHHHDPPMASPSQHSPMTNNSNSSSQNGGPVSGLGTGTGSGTPSGGSKSSNHTASAGGSENTPMLTKPRLTELVREVDTTTQLDEDVEELLLQIIDDFVEDTVKSTSAFAKHRKSNKIEVRDVQLHFERKYNMWIPGFGTDELRPYKRAAVTEAHKQRLALIRKTIKKY
ncbi:transcription initiation factor TFIID subunit 12 isoform X1 [Drosophila suzukii]|uniref:Transcription initiation factor TFIID subunit 12 n=2 Tax=Drosophila suzukii TaxID=28584 RepID=A0AB40ABE0_DROSZ|nr:transcription initiation factor TFIID subunit 12 isoform X1 [Drosophila suzukii]XP_037711712.1 transcription initiation factor TFIID subunit 12 isoform X1 [Drosophila subpulchrella]